MSGPTIIIIIITMTTLTALATLNKDFHGSVMDTFIDHCIEKGLSTKNILTDYFISMDKMQRFHRMIRDSIKRE